MIEASADSRTQPIRIRGFISRRCCRGYSSWSFGNMPGVIVDAGLGDFETVLKAAEVQGPGLLLVLFLGDRIASVGKSWCPDCVRAEPIIYKLVNESETPVTLVRVYVGDRPTWRTPDHPLRCDERFKLKGVPTLVRWENGAITGRLEDYEADKETKIKKLMAST